MDDSIRKSTILKIIAFLLFCLGCVGTALYGTGIIGAVDFGMIDEQGYQEVGDYRDSYSVTYSMRQHALDAVDINVTNDEFISILPQDLMIRVYETEDDEKTLLYDDIDEKDLYRSETVTIHSEIYENQDGSLYWYTYPDGERIREQEYGPNVHPSDGANGRTLVEMRTYDVEVGVRKQLAGDSFISRNCRWQELLQDHLKEFIPGTVFSAIAVLVGLAMMIWTAGWKKNAETPQPSWLGKVPYDLLTVILAGACVTAAYAMVSMAEYFDVNVVTNRSMAAGFLALMFLFAAFIYVWLYELAARLRNGTFIRNNIITYLVVWMWKMCMAVLRWVLQHIILPFIDMMKSFFRLPLVWQLIWLGCTGFVLSLALYAAGHMYGAAAFLLALAGMVVCFLALRCFIGVRTVSDLAGRIASGDYPEETPDSVLRIHAEPFRTQIRTLSSVSTGLKNAVDEAMKSEHLKTELITNVSHDIKTPLTSIINYADLLQKDPTEEQRKEYVDRLYKQSLRLKKLTEDLVEASKASTGNIPLSLGPVYIAEILEQSLAEYDEKFSLMNLDVITEADRELKATADGRLLWRVISNLLSNVSKYALPGTRVYINAGWNDAGKVSITIRNISAEPLNISSDELKERFVRGDTSRHTEGSGLGLNIAESLMKMMNGELNIIIDGDLFKSELILPAA